MKGITHFVSGVALASFLPTAVQAGATGNPLYFVLGGVFGILPDTLDFKFVRFFARRDMEVIPDPLAPDPQMIANAVTLAIRRAWESGQAVRIKLNTIRLGADRWQQYRLRFDPAGCRVLVTLGPAVNTSRNPAPGASAEDGPKAESPLPCAVHFDYEAVTTIDILDGPMLAMVPVTNHRVEVQFIPWHRGWSHSLPLAALLGFLTALGGGATVGITCGGAFALHILEDQLGFLGSNLFFPFTRRRWPGWHLTHSMDTLWNFGFVWTSLLLIFWNLARATPPPTLPFALIPVLLYGAVIPMALAALLRRLLSTG